jgi:hypothetical protein
MVWPFLEAEYWCPHTRKWFQAQLRSGSWGGPTSWGTALSFHCSAGDRVVKSIGESSAGLRWVNDTWAWSHLSLGLPLLVGVQFTGKPQDKYLQEDLLRGVINGPVAALLSLVHAWLLFVLAPSSLFPQQQEQHWVFSRQCVVSGAPVSWSFSWGLIPTN